MERERRCNVIRVPHGAGRFGSVLVWPGLVGLFCLFKVDIRAVDARVGGAREREAEAEERRKGGRAIFTSFRFHSIQFVFVFSSSFLFFHLSSQNLASLGLLSPFSSFSKARFTLSICLEKYFSFFFLSFFFFSGVPAGCGCIARRIDCIKHAINMPLYN
jgi:hypothetical protein